MSKKVAAYCAQAPKARLSPMTIERRDPTAHAELLADDVDDRYAALAKEKEIDRLLADIKAKRQ